MTPLLLALAALIAALCAADVLAGVLLRSRRFGASWEAFCDWNSVQDEKERLRALRPSSPRVMKP